MTGRLKGIPFTMQYSISSYFITVIFSVNMIYSVSSNFQLKFSKSLFQCWGFPPLVVSLKAEKTFPNMKWGPGRKR